MIQHFPQLDGRGQEEILAQAQALAPYYLPRWAAGDAEDPGTALLQAFARMMEETIRRFNRVPEKNLIAFLDMLGVELIPPRPARVPLTFSLSAGAPGSVVIPARFQAAGNPPQGGDPVLFETEKAIAATPAVLSALFSVFPQLDQIFDHRGDLQDGGPKPFPYALFNGAEAVQQHVLYLGDADLFNLTAAGNLRLRFETGDPALLSSRALVWEWSSGEGQWTPFGVKEEGGDILLDKQETGEVVPIQVNGAENRWIRARLAKPLGKFDPLASFPLSGIQAIVDKTGLLPEAALRNDIPLLIPPAEADETIKPFGRRPRQGDIFYLAHQEAFSKPGARVLIEAELEKGIKVQPRDLDLSWEYWGGSGWKALKAADGTKQFTLSESVAFEVPDDLSPIEVDGLLNRWVRVRIASGDYGEEVFTPGEPPKTGSILPPLLSSLTISYSLPPRPPQAALSFNNLQFRSHGQERFFPFLPLQDDHPTVYLGFDSKLEKSPLSLFFHLREQGGPGGSGPPLEWQYSGPPSADGQEHWQVLQALDSTRNLLDTGTVEFAAPSALTQRARFRRSLYWIRIIDLEDRFHPQDAAPPEEAPQSEAPEGTVPAPILDGLFLNTTWAVQAESVEKEVVGSSDGSANQTFFLTRLPVSGEIVWVDELAVLSEAERRNLAEEDPSQVEEIRDEEGVLTGFLVRWRPVEDLLEAAPVDRVYAIDRVSGQIRFGDGEQGRVPLFGIDNIQADYQTGGGALGNLGAAAVTALRSTLPFVDSVVNPLPAGGGSDTEELERALQRGPQRIRNRGRAVTCLDFEWLALEASASVARAKCLSNFDSQGLFEPNRVTVAIVPESEEPRPLPTVALRRTVEQYLLERAANVTAVPRRVRVIGAAYLEVRVEATLVPQSLDSAPQAESEAVQLLSQFLHPLTGGDRGTGWEFGRRPCLSDLYSLLESIEEVDHVEELSTTLTEVDPSGRRGEPLLIAHDGLPEFPVPSHSLIFSGEHNIIV